VKPAGKPDAGNRHVRFDERGWETGRWPKAQATAPILDSTLADTPTTIAERRRLERAVRTWSKTLTNDEALEICYL
jgi:hypothetical protein